MITISIIIVNFNAAHYLIELIDSIKKYTTSTPFEILIVDNNSDPNDIKLLEQLETIPKIKIVKLEQNMGFAKANNIAATIAIGKYILLLNPDTLFLEDSLQKVLKFRETKNCPCNIGIKLLNSDFSIQSSRQTFPRLSDYLSQAFFLNTLFKNSKIFNRINYGYFPADQIREVDSAGGAFLLIDKVVYQKLNGLDENYFLYSEEVDFCKRANKSGLKTYYFPETAIIHYGGGSTKSQSVKYFVELHKSLLYYLQRYEGDFYAKMFRIVLFFSTFNRFILHAFLSVIKKDRDQYKKNSQLYLSASFWLINSKNHKVK